MMSKHANDLVPAGPAEIACIFDGLPVSVGSCVVPLQLDNDEPAPNINSKQVEPLTGSVEAAELLGDYEQVFTYDARIGCDPLLYIPPFLKAELREFNLLQCFRFSCRRVDP